MAELRVSRAALTPPLRQLLTSALLYLPPRLLVLVLIADGSPAPWCLPTTLWSSSIGWLYDPHEKSNKGKGDLPRDSLWRTKRYRAWRGSRSQKLAGTRNRL